MLFVRCCANESYYYYYYFFFYNPYQTHAHHLKRLYTTIQPLKYKSFWADRHPFLKKPKEKSCNYIQEKRG